MPKLNGRPFVSHCEWRSIWANVFLHAQKTIVFSKSSHDLIDQAYEGLGEKIELRPHKMENLPSALASQGKNVGILGSLSLAKGAQVIQRLSSRLSTSRKLIVLGEMDGKYALRRPHIVHGRYEQERISELAARYDIGVWIIPSICPETFSFATHEALATGLPVLAFSRGAQGEAVENAKNGRPITSGPDDTEALALEIERAFAL